jgi:hypothetical protein
LDMAAQRGLQVIVLTCNPKDYDRFGAKLVTLKSPALQAPRSNAIDESIPSDTADITQWTPPASSATIEVSSSLTAATATVGRVRSQRAFSSSSAVSDEACDEFLEQLIASGGQQGNGSLRGALGWSVDKYDPVKEHLIVKGKIAIGRGRGGSVTLLGN